jgi:hypothetical protein
MLTETGPHRKQKTSPPHLHQIELVIHYKYINYFIVLNILNAIIIHVQTLLTILCVSIYLM